MSDPIWIPAIPPPPPVGSSTPKRRVGMLVGAIALVLTLLAGTFVFLSVRSGEHAEAQPLALAFTEGQSESYEIHQTMDGQISSPLLGGDQPLAMDLTQVVRWVVTHVDADGLATIELTVSEMSGTFNGAPIPSDPAAARPIEFEVAPDGEIVSAGGLALGGAGQTQGLGFPWMGQITPILPQDGGPVAPGDTWERSFSQDVPFGEGAVAFEARSRYDRNETVDGHQAAVIVTDMTVPVDLTLRIADLLDALGESGSTGASGPNQLSDASLSSRGEGSFTQTSSVDLQAQELLRTESSGSFDLTMALAGIPGFEGEIGFTGTFTQRLDRR